MKRYFVLMLFLFGHLSGRTQESRSDIPLLMKRLAQSKEDTNRISLQFKLGSYYRNKDETDFVEYKNNLDSASFLFNQALQLSLKLNETDWQYKTLDMIADCISSIDPSRSKQILLQAVNHHRQQGNINKEAQALKNLADAYFQDYNFNDDVPQKIAYLHQARELYLKSQEPIEAARILTDIAAQHVAIKLFDQAEKELQQSLTEYKVSGYKKMQYTYMTLVDLEYARGNYYRALAYCLEGIKNTAEGESIRYTSYFYWNAARCNYSKKKYQQAVDWLRKAIDIDGDHSDYKYFLVETLLASGRTEEALLMLNQTAKEKFLHTSWDTLNNYRCLALYYEKKGNTDLTLQYYHKCLDITRKVFGDGGYSWFIICYNGIAASYLRANQETKAQAFIMAAASTFKKAKTTVDPAILVNYYNNSSRFDVTTGHFRAAFKNSKTPLSRGLLVEFYNNSYKYDVAIGNYGDALKNLELRVKLQDTLFTIAEEEQLAELDRQYQNAQQEESIKVLNSQSAEQQARLETANLQRNITIGGILVMILVSVLFYTNYKQKQVANNIITHKNDLLQHLLTEKEWLLKEVHHRVKNNLQMVISLMESQALYLQDDALKANELSKHRMYAMSLIHQQLYKGEDIRSIDMSVFLPELLDYLGESFDIEREISFSRDIAPLKLGISQAIPIALIVNEAVTNAIKYAFVDGKPGIVRISMHESPNKFKLVISDNGVGIDPAILSAETSSMGIKLMKGLTGEMDGEIYFVNENGTTITICFKPDPLNEFGAF